jgi:hypothetical protein
MVIHSGSHSKIINYKSLRSRNNNSRQTLTWKEKINGTWNQTSEEGLSSFLEFTGQSYVNIKLAELSFYNIRHTLSISDGYFYYLRDLGQDIREWSVKIKIGLNEETAESHYAIVDTGDAYFYRVWCDEEKEILYMESIPEDNIHGTKMLHARKIIDYNTLEMVIIISILYTSIYYYM